MVATTQRSKPSEQTAWPYDDPKPRLFTDDDCRSMIAAGILSEDERAVLLGGSVHVENADGGIVPRLFTRVEYYAMAKAGIIGYDERLQLIEGEIVAMAPMGNRHAAAIEAAPEELLLNGIVQRGASVRSQTPIRISEALDPEPDAMVLKRRDDRYAQDAPRPEDVLLIVEISDSTLNYDVDVKIPMYAAAGIPELWIMNLREDVIDSHSDPSSEGYRATRRYQLGDVIAPLAFPDVEIEVSKLIPARD